MSQQLIAKIYTKNTNRRRDKHKLVKIEENNKNICQQAQKLGMISTEIVQKNYKIIFT